MYILICIYILYFLDINWFATFELRFGSTRKCHKHLWFRTVQLLWSCSSCVSLSLGCLKSARKSDEKCKLIWVFAFIYFDACGVKQGLRNFRFHLQNKIKTRWWDSKNEIGFWWASCLWICCCSLSRFNLWQLVLEWWYSRMQTRRQGNMQQSYVPSGS